MTTDIPYRPVGENPDPARPATPADAPPPQDPAPLLHVRDDNPAHDASAAPDD